MPGDEVPLRVPSIREEYTPGLTAPQPARLLDCNPLQPTAASARFESLRLAGVPMSPFSTQVAAAATCRMSPGARPGARRGAHCPIQSRCAVASPFLDHDNLLLPALSPTSTLQELSTFSPLIPPQSPSHHTSHVCVHALY